MKKDIHPENFRKVIFHDITSGEKFLLGSTVSTDAVEKWEDGNEYPLYRIEISSASHPFYTGQDVTLDTGGRVDKFKKRMEAAAAKAPKKAKKAAPVDEPKIEATEEVPADAPAEEVAEEATPSDA